MDSMGISSYYKSLPRGEKDGFIREIADAIAKSSSMVRMKIREGKWSVLEFPIVVSVIEKRRL